MKYPRTTLHARIWSAACGTTFGAVMVAGIGSWTRNVILGASAGGLLGGVLGYGVAAGFVSRVTVGALFLAILGILIGPAVDDYGGHLAIPGALLGAFIGWLCQDRRRVRTSDEMTGV